MNVKWTDDREKLLKILWADGHSASQIASRLGDVTRSAVIGKVHRMGWSGRGSGRSATARANPFKAIRLRRTQRLRALKREIWAGDTGNPSAPYQPLPEPDIPPHERKRILISKDGKLHANDELTDQCCRWIVGDPRDAESGFCGRQKFQGLPYCQAHAQMAYQAPQTRKRAFAPSREELTELVKTGEIA